ncbi:NAD(P)/FAD-dependent oxidoreductase [Pseudemcibacter aquimaris]|uniref:NAD(P)/FAD-dependent oxidoreductase n=1 Tax=Pseudemcibacter aquimaris TaxID=2857064 RepID=UPI002012327F|nr:NAD(P)/FAD-dependent oxidoreductase [Pseudemcibacter aquimaris]MCC3861009.1 NAD(P)/FAD-dependent oxidoreductase [Pseudemcibacter aquimaris]WDU59827.1 NAD(P)/FAD-dependent oxidoreductase [Pseudemcibacter aquimaris]
MANQYDVIIIGGGAAGLMCAIEAGKRGRSVLVIEKGKSIAGKIRISGGGRCNFTNIHCTHNDFISENPHFHKSALKRYGPYDFIDLVEKHGIAYHEKTLGQQFCDDGSGKIIGMLLDECDAAGVEIKLNAEVLKVSCKEDQFELMIEGTSYECASLVIASGGPSIPKMGATGFGYDVARQFGLKIVDPVPALVPLTFGEDYIFALRELRGVSQEVIVKCGKKSFREALLFTYKGLSGPAILQISSYWRSGQEIIINLAPGTDVFDLLKSVKEENPKQEVQTTLASILPKRLAQYLCEKSKAEGRLADLSHKKLQTLATLVNEWHLTPKGTEGFATAEVTRGGVSTDELSSKTFEAKKQDGLYFIGEVVDVTGHLGGFNFQWAWASGHAAGQFV